LLRATGALVLPTRVPVRLLATAEDVTHAWALPALGIKLDCVPGRLFVSFLNIQREGVFYGQCSELCG
jgi:cytochrome c oxidase subunit 2